MKKIILNLVLCVVLSFCLASCDTSSNGEYYGDYHDGYYDGYENGYADAFSDAQSYADEVLSHIIYKNNVEEALTTLILYADGEPSTEKELHKAIWTISDFYDAVGDMINDLDDYIR